MKRRKFIIASLGTVAAVSAAVGARLWNTAHDKRSATDTKRANGKEPIFFSLHQYAVVAKLASCIIPGDDTPGAKDAKVASFIDQRVANSRRDQRLYTKGLRQLDEYSQSYGNDVFLLLSEKQQYEILEHLFDTYYHQKNTRRDNTRANFLVRKVAGYWKNIFGLRQLAIFLGRVRRDTMEGFYSHPLGWGVAGYYGPPQPLGYPNYSSAPEHRNQPEQFATRSG